jgi:lincosamide nucleotidyltransferase A/C/D/E
MVRTEDACEIIKYALQNEIKVYLDGGWGVDALLKRESRIHNDIDLFVELKHYHDYIYVIKQHGFEEVNTDYTTDGHTVWKDDKQMTELFMREIYFHQKLFPVLEKLEI